MLARQLWQSAVAIQQYLDSKNHQFCFIGGIAIQRWGEPRLTNALDLTLFADFGRERSIIDDLLGRFQARIDDAGQFALQSRVLLMRDNFGSSIDLAFGGMPFESRMIERSSLWGVPGSGKIRTCSAEDLVTLKAFASRPQDWIDVEKIIIRQASKLKREQIEFELEPLVKLKEEPEIMDNLDQLFQKHP